MGKINHSLTGIGHQVYLFKKFNFPILYSGQCGVSLFPVILHTTVLVLWIEILDFKFYFT